MISPITQAPSDNTSHLTSKHSCPPQQRNTADEEEHHLRRLATYRKYRRNNAENCRKKTRERMAQLCAAATEEQKERHRQAQRLYRERYRETIAHRARRAAVERSAAAGKATRQRPKQYLGTGTPSHDEEDPQSPPSCAGPPVPGVPISGAPLPSISPTSGPFGRGPPARSARCRRIEGRRRGRGLQCETVGHPVREPPRVTQNNACKYSGTERALTFTTMRVEDGPTHCGAVERCETPGTTAYLLSMARRVVGRRRGKGSRITWCPEGVWSGSSTIGQRFRVPGQRLSRVQFHRGLRRRVADSLQMGSNRLV
ncbi:hypothetical protein K438DRAFT_1771673 [Mycena galopus ATCC 62051]|nr:hypothetical protein K438DRAFT_1771673 [Mycena galopus ATCC 62051]